MYSRFVIQEHTTPNGVHWDLMLEQGDALTTFRLDRPPPAVLEGPVAAVRIFDHPLRFLTYEGPVQKGTGQVRIVERGTCRLGDQMDGVITMDLQGEILRGRFTLTRIEGTSGQTADEKGTFYFFAHQQTPGDK